MKLFRHLTCATALLTGAATASAQTTPEWRPLAVADPQNSVGATLVSTDSRSSLAVKCDRSEGYANLSIQFLPKPELGVGDMPVLYEVGTEPDDFPFEQLWSRLPDTAAYIESGQNGELPEALASIISRDGGRFVIDAKDKTGKAYRQEFSTTARKREYVDAAFMKCRGKTVAGYGALSRGWTLEQSKTAAGRPVYTAWLPSVDKRAAIGVRCTYTDKEMRASFMLKSIHGGFLMGAAPTLVSGEHAVDLPFEKRGPNEWEWTDEDGAIQLAQALMRGGDPIFLRLNRSSSPRGTLFAPPSDGSVAQIKSAMTMCNIPI